MLARTFGCVRKVWDLTLAWRQARWRDNRESTGFLEANAFLTELEKDPEHGYLTEVSCVPLRQAIRTQQTALGNFFAKRARYPRFKAHAGRQSAEHTRSGFRWREGRLSLAKMDRARKAHNLARYQRRMARKQRGFDNRHKARVKVARAQRKVRAAHRDHVHRVSAGLVRRHDHMVIEDLAVRNMVKNRSLAKAISDAGWGESRRQLEYKCTKYGRALAVIDRWYPSSKLCSACGRLLGALDLPTRTWTCPGCGTLQDRDLNAARNILAAGLAVSACGADVRHSGFPRVPSATKQEPQPARAGIPGLSRREGSQRWTPNPGLLDRTKVPPS